MSQNITRFPNGIRLVTEKMPGTLSASIGIWASRGARHERPEQNGIAHFLEHMAFKGTKSRTALQIAEAIENVGGYLNAYTAKDMTAYYARVLGQDVSLALDVLSDILLNPLFSSKDIEIERGVILQELGQTLDTPDDIIFDWLTEECFPNQALGRPILGTPEHIRNFQSEDFRKFVAENYGGDNLIISASGNVDHDVLAQSIERKFADLPYRSLPISSSARFQYGQKRIEKDLEQAHLALAFESPSLKDEKQYTAQLLSSILGGGMSSRLFQSIREERGLCYTIFSSQQMLEDHGQLLIYSGTSEEGIDALMAALTDELRNFAGSVGKDELMRAKAQMRAGSVMALEAVASRTERNARQIISYDELISIEDSLQKIEAITLNDLDALAHEIFTTRPQMVLYGRISQARDFDGFMAGLR